MTTHRMQVALSDEGSTLNVRNAPCKKGERIDRLNHGAIVTVQAEVGDWKFVTYDGGSGYVSNDFLIPCEESDIVGNNDADIVPNDTVVDSNNKKITIIDSAGNHFEPIGDWHVLIGSVD